MKWRVGYFPTIMSGPVARFRFGRAELSTSRDGVCVDAPTPMPATTLGLALDAAGRVHDALAREYRFRPISGPKDSHACIQAALGVGWTLERPSFGAEWPGEEPK